MTAIAIDEFLPHPPDRVWHALTDSGLMARWLMRNDLRLEPEGTGTRLFVEHDGFDLTDPYRAAARRILGHGWQAIPGRIAAILDEARPGRGTLKPRTRHPNALDEARPGLSTLMPWTGHPNALDRAA